MTNRAFSILTVKSFDDDKRIIRGIATTPETDRTGDIVVSSGVKFRNPAPLLWQHQHDKPVGTVRFDPPTERGVTFEAQLPFINEPGALRDRVEEAWHSIRSGLVTAVSIGFRAMEGAVERMKNGGIKYLSVDVIELSLVTIPANASATITDIKSIDNNLRAKNMARTKGVSTMPTNEQHRATVSLNRGLDLQLWSMDARKEVSVKLSRIEAQHLAEALLDFAGVQSSAYVLGNKFILDPIDRTPVPREFQKRPQASLQLGGTSPKGAVKLMGKVKVTRR